VLSAVGESSRETRAPRAPIADSDVGQAAEEQYVLRPAIPPFPTRCRQAYDRHAPSVRCGPGAARILPSACRSARCLDAAAAEGRDDSPAAAAELGGASAIPQGSASGPMEADTHDTAVEVELVDVAAHRESLP